MHPLGIGRLLLSLALTFITTTASVQSQYPFPFDPLNHLSGVAPPFLPHEPPLDPAPPQGCNVTRAAHAVRHASIYANDFDWDEFIEPFITKLNASQQNSASIWSASPRLSFLAGWKTPIEDEDLEALTQIGRRDAQRLGRQIQERYSPYNFRTPAKIWASSAERTHLSAESFIQGYTAGNNNTQLVITTESKERGADTLTPWKGCPAYHGSRGSDEEETFQRLYAKPVLSRLRAEVPSFNWTFTDVVAMQVLCGYETVIRGSSSFCSRDLFSPNEWLAFEYSQDLFYHHNLGYSHDVPGVMGWPWVEASTNLLLKNETPAQDLYVSFSHREMPPSILVALGLFNNSAFSGANDINATMPETIINTAREWQTSRFLMFLSDVAVERLECDSYGFQDEASSVGQYFRVLVNEVPQLLPGCTDGPGWSCGREGFEKFLQERKKLYGGFSKKCQVSYSNSTDTLTIYGQ